MKGPEARLWQKIREKTKSLDLFWTRVETWATPGIPDLHGVTTTCSFWLELKVHRLKSLKYVELRPHQIAWQTQYSNYNGNVWNLVSHPASHTINIFSGKRAMEIGQRTNKNELDPCFIERGKNVDWKKIFDYIITHSNRSA